MDQPVHGWCAVEIVRVRPRHELLHVERVIIRREGCQDVFERRDEAAISELPAREQWCNRGRFTRNGVHVTSSESCQDLGSGPAQQGRRFRKRQAVRPCLRIGGGTAVLHSRVGLRQRLRRVVGGAQATMRDEELPLAICAVSARHDSMMPQNEDVAAAEFVTQSEARPSGARLDRPVLFVCVEDEGKAVSFVLALFQFKEHIHRFVEGLDRVAEQPDCRAR